MSSQVTITAVQENDVWSNEHGTYKNFTVTVRSAATGETRDAKRNVKGKKQDDGTFRFYAPKVGDNLETDIVKITQPPGWQLKNVKFLGSSGSGADAQSYGGGASQDEFRRSKEQMTVEAADHTAAILLLAMAQGLVWSNEEFSRLSKWLQGRATAASSLQAQPPVPQGLPEARRDIERTGGSDVPQQEQEFVHAQQPRDGSDIPW